MTEETFAAASQQATGAEEGVPGVVVLARLAALTVDSDGRLTHWNLGAEELFGHRRNDVLDRTTTGLLPLSGTSAGDALDRLDDLVSVATPWAGELAVTDRDGRLVEIHCWAWRTVEPSGRGMLVLAADARQLRGPGLRIAVGEQLLPFAAAMPGGPGGGTLRAEPVHMPCGSRAACEATVRRLLPLLPRAADERRRALLAQLVEAGAPALRLDGLTLPLSPVPDQEPPAPPKARGAARTKAKEATPKGAKKTVPSLRRPERADLAELTDLTDLTDRTDLVEDDGLLADALTEQTEHAGELRNHVPVPAQARPRAESAELAERADLTQYAGDEGPFTGPPSRPSVSLTGGEAPGTNRPDDGDGSGGGSREQPVNPQLRLLTDVGSRIGTTLDLDRTVHELCDVVVPGIADFASVELSDRLISDSESPRDRADDDAPLRRVACAFGPTTLPWKHLVVEGSLVSLADDTPSGYALEHGQPVLVPRVDPATARSCAAGRGGPALDALFEGRSMLTLPLAARGTVLGVLVLLRDASRPAFDEADASYLRELAVRAALSIDNARLHRMEARTALTLQRSMLPTRPPRIPGVQVAHRYLPGDRRAEVGGDWFDAVQLPGSRVALVVGDVMGHGLHSAVAMGRFRTALQTLAALDLPPGQILRHLDNLSQRLGDDHLATCLYAVYDPIARTCTLASAGHVPPVLVHPDGRGELLEIPSGAPIGVGGVPFASREVKVTDGSMLVLCTDGLVEMRGGDIGDGLAALCGDIVDPRRSPDEVCDTVLERLHTEDRSDDLALLIARFDGIPPQDVISWSLRLDTSEVRRSRSLVQDQLARWGLTELSEVTQLLVSELVTNALRVAKGSVELQLMRVGKLLVEVSDDDHNLPSLEPSELLDEEGRGLGLVSQMSARWGTSRKAVGKVVWFELPLPVRP
ncbi:ATP-binding SpoIIE family protein phosphatase [Streptacidiphilus fuscans]|uniref:protein-serine/threonine phosphatase n=1 Tax=Streptacidiphilus fuscans TaxID=2789292 RepID=A0A931FC83_9ACTN|nr:SpoIIE family protein phosphatase [Streptacidiphilus fuscans]MBF9068208.1 SpoIIE family protein phosphatase [Streptacidiphilus fuscans]